MDIPIGIDNNIGLVRPVFRRWRLTVLVPVQDVPGGSFPAEADIIPEDEVVVEGHTMVIHG